MEFVQPIRDKRKIDNMKKILLSTNIRDYCLFTLGINSGLRISDLLFLKISDVLNNTGKIRERITIRERKTNKTKNFPIADIAQKAILEYLKTRTYQIDEPLFISRKKNKGIRALQRDQAYKIINNAARAVGIREKIGTHTLRKTFGYHAFKKGITIEVIQKLFNHSASSITLRYIGITQDDLDQVYLDLNL
ncbi:site-specific integrase [Sporomusa sphaeroides]|uniref:Tyrosine recombinase XerC n=1 Tax=Sporomusa sphaeroides DSM 2875 TaxID=1337886 RepID=A0A1U7MA61_9FIRM|nr:site-specific integrase [Sporomusa sphaeroides]OLS54357.1 tyrosine recombinase XerC [Sporomusa sphaeroides DSM 2875]CVK21653.1 Tyrosine recombinase XerC [Sporomusa sphaeroides DSM 2875]